jgi:hypothetical protein
MIFAKINKAEGEDFAYLFIQCDKKKKRRKRLIFVHSIIDNNRKTHKKR